MDSVNAPRQSIDCTSRVYKRKEKHILISFDHERTRFIRQIAYIVVYTKCDTIRQV